MYIACKVCFWLIITYEVTPIIVRDLHQQVFNIIFVSVETLKKIHRRHQHSLFSSTPCRLQTSQELYCFFFRHAHNCSSIFHILESDRPANLVLTAQLSPHLLQNTDNEGTSRKGPNSSTAKLAI